MAVASSICPPVWVPASLIVATGLGIALALSAGQPATTVFFFSD
jgi:hypothetical protein